MADVVVRRLLDSKAAPDQQNVQGDIPLLWACRAGARGAACRDREQAQMGHFR